ncbi:hypothetical protein PENSUB_12562 [Penicillium subrubescens]|uniref:Uncharacterized protein n=1 Tax=Penicillium subrubescens TaxID=1316194 RepID=A0A1Q5SY64_9EURO|nr:hypothetical protein PENSUB_12562 [Penicillium subrubescens]
MTAGRASDLDGLEIVTSLSDALYRSASLFLLCKVDILPFIGKLQEKRNWNPGSPPPPVNSPDLRPPNSSHSLTAAPARKCYDIPDMRLSTDAGASDYLDPGVESTPKPTRTMPRRRIRAEDLDDCIAHPNGRKKTDIFEFGRRDLAVPLDVIFGPIEKEYIKTGKIGGFAVSEARAETIHEAVKHTWVLAVEAETTYRESSALQNTMIDINRNSFSAISTDILEIGAVAGLGPV